MRQFWTLYPHTPDNSFLGFIVEYPNSSHQLSYKKNQAVLYGKDGMVHAGHMQHAADT